MLILISAEPACSAFGLGTALEVLNCLFVCLGHVSGVGLVFIGPGQAVTTAFWAVVKVLCPAGTVTCWAKWFHVVCLLVWVEWVDPFMTVWVTTTFGPEMVTTLGDLLCQFCV